MKKPEGAPVELVFPATPGGSPVPAGTGVFHETGEFPNTYPRFFARYAGGKEIILPGSKAGGGQGVRAQVGGGEGHTEQTLSPALMAAAKDPNNPWGITEDDVSERVVGGVRMIDWTLMDFLAIYGRQGFNEAVRLYGQGAVTGAPQGRPAGQPSTNPQPSDGNAAVLRELGEIKAKLDRLSAPQTQAHPDLSKLRNELIAARGELGNRPAGAWWQKYEKRIATLEKLLAKAGV